MIDWNLHLQYLGCEALSQICYLLYLNGWSKYWKKRAKGLKDLQIHCEKQRWLMEQPYGKYKSLKLYIKLTKSRICYLCGKWIEWKDIEVDHFIPIIARGYSIVSNLFNTHSWCNKRKGRKIIKRPGHFF